jgi:hypothetical protein
MIKIINTVTEEIGNRDTLTKYYNKQLIAMRRLFTHGMTYEEYKTLLDDAPSVPHYNHFVFMPLAEFGSKNLQAGQS